LCRTLLEHPDLLLLDEPTNHLDVETVRWLEETLRDYKGTVVCITHDRFFLDNVVGWMLEVWHGRAIPYQGNYSEYLIQRAKRMEAQESQEQKRGKFLERELEWIRMNPKARTTKNKARLKNYDKMLETEVEERDDTVELHIPAGKRLGDTVIRFEKVCFSYDGVKNVVENLSFEMQPGDILGIVGPNGTGKTTCLKMITGRLKPQSGKVTVGQTVDLCHVDQERESLDPAKTVWQEISEGQDLIKLGKHRGQQPQLRREVQLHRAGPAAARRLPVGWSAQSRAARQDAAPRRQRDPARRADQRPRPRHAACARGGDPGIPRLHGGRLPRPLLPRPHLHQDPRPRQLRAGQVPRQPVSRPRAVALNAASVRSRARP
jgi:ABC-type multidrug transport system ATPase subunit